MSNSSHAVIYEVLMAVSSKIMVSWVVTLYHSDACVSEEPVHCITRYYIPEHFHLNAYHCENCRLAFYIMFLKYFLPFLRVTKSTILWIQRWEWLHGSRRWWTTISWRQSVILRLILYIQLEFRPSQVWVQALCLHLYLSKLSREVCLIFVVLFVWISCPSVLTYWTQGNKCCNVVIDVLLDVLPCRM
jgi:hypothetical protein